MVKSTIPVNDPSMTEGLLALAEGGDFSSITNAISTVIEGCSGLQLAFVDANGNFHQCASPGLDADNSERLRTEFSTPLTNPVIAKMAGLPTRRFVDVWDMVDVATYLESEFYHEMMKPREPCSVAMMSAPGKAGLLSLGLEQDAAAPLPDHNIGAWFAEQVHRAVGLFMANTAPSRSSLLLDGAGYAIGNSAANMELFSLGALKSAGPNRPARPNSTNMLAEFGLKLRAATKGNRTEMILPGDAGPCRVRFAPGPNLSTLPTAWVDVEQLQGPIWTSSSLEEIFGLTPREASVVVALLQSQDIRKVATHLGLTTRSVRTYLSSIYDKTETSGQVELIGVLMGLDQSSI